MNDLLVQVKNLKMYFPVPGDNPFRNDYLRAVDDVTLDIYKGEVLGLVGESGCGKSTLGNTILHLLKPTAGTVEFEGQDLSTLSAGDMKSMRRKIQMIFQDPSASLNPRRTIGNALLEPFRIHKIGTPKEREDRINFLINRVGLSEYHLSRYPHELSGGQKQRVSIARALTLNPEIIVCDEAVSALDVSIQAQVIDLLEDLQKDFNLTYLFISHDLSVVYYISDRVAVMYLGKVIELGSKDSVFERTLHPYSKALISAIPKVDPDQVRERIILQGDLPSPVKPPSGCRFHVRCNQCMEICKEETPEFKEYETGHFVACHLYENR
ncbi:MAG TPA: ATP-binding cassette domain-containing protein [Clostridiaceae bacterium]|nr:ATP-binding cassette domain-containing protein [Clostridiaceae bacterium]